MGRKSSNKGKEKRQKRKEASAKVAASQALVVAANKLLDPFEKLQLGAFTTYDRNGLNLTIECKRVNELDAGTVDSCLKLTKANMQDIYEQTEGSWSDRQKKDEMTDEAAWYLIARDDSGNLVACVHFRFDLDYETEVVYCYEIQLVESVRRKGLGKFLMQILELLAFRTRMKKVICTVFNVNSESSAFFRSLRYEVDETQPDPLIDGEVDYEILSKTINPTASKASNKSSPANAFTAIS